MFYSINGILTSKDENQVIIETGGIGFEIAVPRSVSQHIPDAGNNITLYVKMIVREDDIYLVGFSTLADRRLFESLTTVSGIGPKQGLKILSDLSAYEIRQAIISGNVTELSKVKGVGAKTASRIILELKDKMSKLNIGDIAEPSSILEKKKLEILLAMRVLGYSDSDSKRVIESTFASSEEIKNKKVEDIIKLILSKMFR